MKSTVCAEAGNWPRKHTRGRAASVFGLASLIVAVGGLLSGNAVSAAPDEAQPLLASGHARFAAKDYPAARAEYARITQQTNAPAFQRSVAQLRLAQSCLCEGDLEAAKAEYAKAAAMQDAPPHHRWEAQQQIKQISRRQQGLSPCDPSATRAPPPKPPAPGATFYVAPDGADANPGTKAGPFATLERARDAVRALKAKGGLPPGGVAVVIEDGRYQVAQTFRLGAEDSGTETAPVIYRAAAGKTPVFTGGARLTGFEPVTDPAVLARLPEEARGKVFQANLKARGITNFGPLELGGFASGRGFRTHPLMELFFNGQAMQLARWPNDGFARVAGVPASQGQQGGGAAGGKTGRLTYEGDRPKRWRDDHDILLYGYWFYDWADSYEQVQAIDTERREITLAPPFHNYGYKQGQRFYALNLLSEIDRPGEWYLDRATGRLFFYPPSDPAPAVIELSTAPFAFVELQNVSRVVFQGLGWELGCADGVIIRDGSHCLLAGCAVRRFGGNGVEIRGGAAHGLLSCDVFSLGRGGTVVTGGDRKTLVPGGHFVENCHIYELSRVDHTYTPAVLLSGVGNRIAHNLAHDVRSSAFRIEGNDHLIEFNEVCRVLLESDDQGGVDMWGDPTFRGNIYRFNYFHHLGNWRNPGQEPACGQAGIRLDDAISGTLVYGNVFYRCAAGKLGFGGVQIHGGKDNIVDNNLFVDCATAVSFSPWGEAHWRDFTKNSLNSPQIQKALYLARYPELARLNEDPNVNWLWRNLVCRCGEFLRRNQGGARLFDNFVTAADPGFADAAQGVFQLSAGAPALEQVSFQPIPFDEIGLYRDAFRTALPAKAVEAMRSTGSLP